jgi:phosphoglycolate phosphatase
MRAVVFDLDGTLVDSAAAINGVAGRFLRELGAEPLDLAETKRFVGRGVPRFLEQAFAARGIGMEDFDRHVARFHQLYEAAPGEENVPYPGAEEMLDALAGAGVALGLCTNKPAAPTRNVLEALGWAGRFGAVVAGDTLAVKKPDPAPLRHAIAALGADPAAVLYVGDSEVDAETAVNAGLPFALFTEGYRKTPVEAIPARFVFSRHDELARHVLAAA